MHALYSDCKQERQCAKRTDCQPQITVRISAAVLDISVYLRVNNSFIPGILQRGHVLCRYYLCKAQRIRYCQESVQWKLLALGQATNCSLIHTFNETNKQHHSFRVYPFNIKIPGLSMTFYVFHDQNLAFCLQKKVKWIQFMTH